MVKHMEMLTDEELRSLISEIPVNDLLYPIQHENRRYKQYIPMLGRLVPGSLGVQKYLPSIVAKEYGKGDIRYVNMVEKSAQNAKNQLIENVVDHLGHEIDDNDLKELPLERWIDIVSAHKQAGHAINYPLFWAQLTLIGVKLSEEDKKSIIDNVEGDDVASNEGEAAINIITEESPAKPKESLPETPQREREQDKESKEKKKKETKTPAEKALQSREARKRAEEEKRNQTNIKNEDLPFERKDEVVVSAPAKKMAEDNWRENKMPTYLGKIRLQNNYYNFTPVAELNGNEFTQLSEYRVDQLLPQSIKRNINLAYSPYDEAQVRFMRDHFYDEQMVLFSFTLDDLQENLDSMGNRNPTGYKVSAQECIKNRTIRKLGEDGFYFLVDKDELEDSLTDKTVRVKNDIVSEGEKILINLGKGFYAGPYTVKYSSTNDVYFIRPETVENKFIIKGYKSENCKKQVVEDGYSGAQWNYEITIYYIRHPELVEYLDVITDEQLLSALEDDFNASKDTSEKGVLDREGIARSKASVLVSDSIPEDIKNKRVRRLTDMFDSNAESVSVLQTMSNIIYNILLNKPNDERAEQLVEMILDNRPDVLDSIQSYRVIRERVESSKHELEVIQSSIEDANKKVADANVEKETIIEKNEEYQKLLGRIKQVEEISDLEERLAALKKDVNYYESHKSHLSNDTRNLESQFVDTINKYSDQMVGLTFDGFMSNKMLQAASDWEARERSRDLNDLVKRVSAIDTPQITQDELLEYVVSTIQRERPQYDRNTIMNIMICVTQGFLTVFSGAPGCGKTSICNIISKTLGLTKVNQLVQSDGTVGNMNRFIPVSVERGWTSKRDFIGYYNPLTKSFEETNREVFDGMRVLDLECRKGIKEYPYLILLDEANLSPMEYYWADFMNVCDDLGDNHTVNLGNDNLFKIPETLHFVATINNDHTTETLSPRLIDRAWIVTLPRTSNVQYGEVISLDSVKLIQWGAMVNAFGIPNSANISLGPEVQRIYDEIRRLFTKINIIVSPRIDIAIKKYCIAASRIMEEDEFGNSASVVALDYAVSQKILPKIAGNGDDYRERLEEIANSCKTNNLLRSADMINGIIRQGDRQMKYYKFF